MNGGHQLKSRDFSKVTGKQAEPNYSKLQNQTDMVNQNSDFCYFRQVFKLPVFLFSHVQHQNNAPLQVFCS